jgi:hypothetical protein
MSLANVVEAVKNAVAPRGGILRRLGAQEAQQASEAAAHQQRTTAAVAERAKLVAILNGPEQLRAEGFAMGLRHDRERAELERELYEARPQELKRFEIYVERLHTLLRASSPPAAIEETNWLDGSRQVKNLDAIERWRALGPLFTRVQAEIRNTLWRLPDHELSERLAVLRRELEAVGDTVLEDVMA